VLQETTVKISFLLTLTGVLTGVLLALVTFGTLLVCLNSTSAFTRAKAIFASLLLLISLLALVASLRILVVRHFVLLLKWILSEWSKYLFNFFQNGFEN
jgi:hypothetical protein